MKKLNWRRSIKFKIPIVIILVFIIPFLCIWWINYSSISSTVIENSGKIIQSKLKSVSFSVRSITQDIEETGLGCINDPEVQSYIVNYLNADAVGERAYYRSLMTIHLMQKKVLNRNIRSVYVFIDDIPFIFTIDAGRKELPIRGDYGKEAYESYRENFSGKTGWMNFHDCFADQNSPGLAYAATTTIGQKRCTLVFPVTESCFSQILTEIDAEHGNIAIYDANDLLILNSDDAGISRKLLREVQEDAAFQPGWWIVEWEGASYMVAYYRSDLTYWKYYQITPMTEILGGESRPISMMGWILAVGIAVAILGAWFVSRNVVMPLEQLVSGMRLVENGKFPQLKVSRKNDEIGMVLNDFNKMVLRINNLINEVYLQQILRKDAQLKSIYAQIDEHFLYNTLNSITCEANEENAVKTEEMLSMLSRYFRMNLSEGKSFLKISEVVALMKCYLSLQKIRFGEKLSIRIHVEEGLENQYVLKYLFQPIVENAIVHGMEEYMEHITVTINLCREGNFLHFAVHNDGKIIEPGELAKIREEIRQTDTVEGKSFALKNINAQIALTYGKEYGLAISSTLKHGTTIGFTIPLRDSDRESTC